MRLGVISLLAITLAACGPSQEEIDNAATITCNIMSESSNMDAGMRIKEVNAAREKIGAPPYLGTNETISESLDWDLCEELIKNDPNYADLVVLKKEAEARRLEEERLAQARAKAEAERKYREIVSDYIAEFKSRPKLLNVEYLKRFNMMDIDFACGDIPRSLYYDLKLEFDGGSLANQIPFRFTQSKYDPQECGITIDTKDPFFIATEDLMSKLRYAELEIKYIVERSETLTPEERIRLHPSTHDLPFDGLENGIIWVLFDETIN